MKATPTQIEAAARVFYASQTGSGSLDTSHNRQAWLNIAERALSAALEPQTWRPTTDDLGYPDEPETIDDGETRWEVRR